MIFMKKQNLALTILIFSMLFVFYLNPSHVYSETSNPFVGTWGYTVLGHKAGSAWFNWKTEAGTLTFNEDGTVTNTFSEGADTCPQNHCLPSQTENFTYTYNPSTREAILNVIDDTVKFVLSDDGSVAIGNGITLQDQQLLIIAVKLDTKHTYSEADVSGSYFTGAYEYDSLGNPYPDGSGKYRLWSVVANAANGNFVFNGYGNCDGTLLSVTGEETLPYQVSPSGYMLIGTAEEGYLTGYVGNGKFIIFSNPPGGVATDFASFVSLKKQDRSYTQQDLAGTWAIATFGDYNGQEFNTHFGTITCNSTGSCSASLTQKTSTGAISNLSKSFNLSVSQDGSLNNFYLTNNTPHFSGAIGNDGNVMILLMNPNGSSTNERLIGVAVKRNSVQPSANSDPGDLALNASVSESDNGWGGGSNKGEIVDGLRTYNEWYHGLAFTGGTGNWAGESCGWRQVTVNFGTPKTFNRVVVWHHGLEHVPNTYKIQYWDGSNWVDVFSTTNGRSYLKYPTPNPINWWESFSTPTENTFPAVTASKVRFALNNCDITHGWIYEIEVYYDQVTTPYTITSIVKDVSENPIQYATIKVWDENNNLIKESQTDQSGSYTIGLSSAGSYTIGVYREGYETITSPQIVYLSDSDPTAFVEFLMESAVEEALLNLSSGWNFISFPRLPADTSISTIMSGKDVRIIWGWDNVNQVWLKWRPLSSDNTLTNFEFGKGYWIYVNAQTTIDMSNWNKPSSSILTLRPGWNLIGWLGMDNRPISDALSSLNNNWRVIWTWEDGTWYGKHTSLNLPYPELTTLKKGKAYWIKMTNEATWGQE